MSYVYGPVPSRRLGQSLGVDPIPFKTCNYNCVYCQLGRTTPVTNKRHNFLPVDKILDEVRASLKYRKLDTSVKKNMDIDFVTIVGQGEPLLCANLGQLVRGVTAITNIPVAVITNGSLLFMPQVQEAVNAANVVIPSLDAGDEETFRQINRPWPKLHINQIIEGMVTFRDIFKGQLWIEVMLVKDVNDTNKALTAIAAALDRIKPDQVHLNVPVRPPAEYWVKIPDNKSLVRAMAILGDVAPIITSAQGVFGLTEGMPIEDAIVEIIRRHPMQESELVDVFSRYTKKQDLVQNVLTSLEVCGQATRYVYNGQTFWAYAGGRFAASFSNH